MKRWERVSVWTKKDERYVNMEILIEKLKKLYELDPCWPETVKEEMESKEQPSDKRLVEAYNEIWVLIRKGLQKNYKETKKIVEKFTGEAGEWILDDVEDTLSMYFSLESIRRLQETEFERAKKITDFLLDNAIFYYDPQFLNDYKNFGFKSWDEGVEATSALAGLIEYYVGRRFTKGAMKRDLLEESGFSDDLCEHIVQRVWENYQELQMGIIVDFLKSKEN